MTKIILAITLSTTLLGCGSTGDGVLHTRLINFGSYPLTAFYCPPTGSVPDTDWQTADWGRNYLTVAQLNSMEFVVFETLPRIDCDGMATFDAGGAVAYRRNDHVRADYLDDPELTIHFSMSAEAEGSGYNWGWSDIPGLIDVTP